MKKFILVVFVLILFVFNGCVSINKAVKNKYDPLIGTATYDDIKKSMSTTKWPYPARECSPPSLNIIFVEYGDLDIKNEEKVKTVYSKGSLFTKASSVSEKEYSPYLDGSRYRFAFDKKSKVLKFYACEVFGNKHFEKTRGGDKKCQSDFEKLSWEERGCVELKSKQKAAATTDSLKQKLEELKKLRDEKVITDAEYKKMREKALLDYK